MVKTTFFGSRTTGWGMNFSAIGESELAEVYQLNSIFLTLLQDAARRGQAVDGLPDRLLRRLSVQSGEVLENMARLPRCLFRLRVSPSAGEVSGRPADDWEAGRRAFAIVALCAAWKSSRRSNPHLPHLVRPCCATD